MIPLGQPGNKYEIFIHKCLNIYTDSAAREQRVVAITAPYPATMTTAAEPLEAMVETPLFYLQIARRSFPFVATPSSTLIPFTSVSSAPFLRSSAGFVEHASVVLLLLLLNTSSVAKAGRSTARCAYSSFTPRIKVIRCTYVKHPCVLRADVRRSIIEGRILFVDSSPPFEQERKERQDGYAGWGDRTGPNRGNSSSTNVAGIFSADTARLYERLST